MYRNIRDNNKLNETEVEWDDDEDDIPYEADSMPWNKLN